MENTTLPQAERRLARGCVTQITNVSLMKTPERGSLFCAESEQFERQDVV